MNGKYMNPLKIKVTKGTEVLFEGELKRYAMSFDKGVVQITGVLKDTPNTDEVAGRPDFVDPHTEDM